MTDLTAPFGTYALPAKRETLRKRADTCGDTRTGRWTISYFRKRAFKGMGGPFDVQVMTGVNARLYPRSNRCEKRVFAGQQIWDAVERAALLDALKYSKRSPFVFFDVGANVGLYSLILAAKARETQTPTLITAIEPDAVNRERLAFNIKASGAGIKILPYAVSDEDGEGVMGGGETNRGEVKLLARTTGDTVLIKTLLSAVRETKTKHINAMKLDIEGHDLRALTAFFNTASQSLWPRLLILETGREPTTPLLELCQKYGYTINARNGINTVLTQIK